MPYNKHYKKKQNTKVKKTQTTPKKMLQKLKNWFQQNNADLPPEEQFTTQGFFAVSGWALLFTLQGGGLLFVFLAFLLDIDVSTWSLWQAGAATYLICWILCFWFLCLGPKLRREN